jgi:hypothetical protein
MPRFLSTTLFCGVAGRMPTVSSSLYVGSTSAVEESQRLQLSLMTNRKWSSYSKGQGVFEFFPKMVFVFFFGPSSGFSMNGMTFQTSSDHVPPVEREWCNR